MTNAIGTEDEWARRCNFLTDAMRELLDDLENVDTTYVYYDRRWDSVRESTRGDEDDPVYVNRDELKELIAKYEGKLRG